MEQNKLLTCLHVNKTKLTFYKLWLKIVSYAMKCLGQINELQFDFLSQTQTHRPTHIQNTLQK